MELSGTIKKLFETQQVSPTFRKREVVIETDENYPQVIMCEFTQDRADIPSRYNEGDKVTVSINIRGREWTNREGETRYFVSIQGWRMAPWDGTTAEPTSAPRSDRDDRGGDRGDRGGNYGGGGDRRNQGGGGDRRNQGGNYGGGGGDRRNQGGNFGGGGDPIARAASQQAPGFDKSNDDDDLPF
jgi:single-stranded DNA-binding protein